MSGSGKNKAKDEAGDQEEFIIDEIVGHMRTEELLKKGSNFAYNADDLKESECRYAFKVRWVGYEGEDTWQSYESFHGDKKLVKNYGRRRALDLFPDRQREFSSSEEIRRRVDEIEEAARRRHGTGWSLSGESSSSRSTGDKQDNTCSKSQKVVDKKGSEENEEVIVLSEDDENVEKRGKGVSKTMKRMATEKKEEIEIDQISKYSPEVIKYDNIPGFKIYLPAKKNKNEEQRLKFESCENKNKEMLMEVGEEHMENGKDRKKKETKGKKNEDAQKRRRVIKMSEDSGEESDVVEKKKKRMKKKNQSSDDDFEQDLTSRKKKESKLREDRDEDEMDAPKKRKTNRPKRFPHGEYDEEKEGMGLVDRNDRRLSSQRKTPVSDDDMMGSSIKNKRNSNGLVKKEQKESPAERKKNSKPKKEIKISSDESDDDSSDESDDEEWKLERIVNHVPVNEVIKGRDIDGKETLNWKMLNKTEFPFLFRISFTHPGNRRKKFAWITIEELDDLPALNRYASTAKITLPKGYAAMMKKKEKKNSFGEDEDDLYEA